MQNAEFLILNPQLTLLCRLFLLAARQSVQAPSALAPQRRFSILNFVYRHTYRLHLEGVSFV